MKRAFVLLMGAAVAASLVAIGCSAAASPPAPTAVPPASPTKAAEAPKPAAPTQAPAAQPTVAPATKAVFPEKGKTITVIMPWPPGGATDVGARVTAPVMERILGVPVQIINKEGAGSQVGLTELAKSKPDGYTIGMANLPNAIVPYLDPDRKSVYGRKDLVQVANQVMDSAVVAVRSESPYKTLKDLLDYAKAHPDELTSSTSGLMSDNHIEVNMLSQAAGVKIRPVAFAGGAPATTAMLGGNVGLSIQTGSAFSGPFKSGQVRFLGSMTTDRVKFYPDVPTLQEFGYKLTYGSVRGWVAPAGTPKEIVDILSRAIKQAMDDPDVAKKMDDMFLPQRYMDPTEYSQYWDQFEATTKPIIDQIKKEAAN